MRIARERIALPQAERRKPYYVSTCVLSLTSLSQLNGSRPNAYKYLDDVGGLLVSQRSLVRL